MAYRFNTAKTKPNQPASLLITTTYHMRGLSIASFFPKYPDRQSIILFFFTVTEMGGYGVPVIILFMKGYMFNSVDEVLQLRTASETDKIMCVLYSPSLSKTFLLSIFVKCWLHNQ
jgi:hypothetical protein